MSEVIKNLEAFINLALPGALKEGVTDMCMDIRNKAVENITSANLVDTGITRASIIMEVQEVSDGVEGVVGSASEVALYHHEGTGLYAKDGKGRKEVPWRYQDAKGVWHTTKGVKPTPFLQDAVDEIRPNMLNYFKGVIK